MAIIEEEKVRQAAHESATEILKIYYSELVEQGVLKLETVYDFKQLDEYPLLIHAFLNGSAFGIDSNKYLKR